MPRSTTTQRSTQPKATGNGAIPADLLEACRQDFASNPAYRLAMNACSTGSLDDVALNRQVVASLDWHFSHEVPTGAITNQKRAGTCWMFASLNWLRADLIAKLKLETFEFSQNYMIFWDRLEKANRFLQTIKQLRDRPTDDRSVDYLLREPSPDGGEWHMVSSLIRKYGVVPKSAMADTYNLSDSAYLAKVLNHKLRQAAAIIYDLTAKQASEAEVEAAVRQALAEVYRILCILLGEPPQRFDFTYRDKKDKFHAHRDLTPQQFYAQFVSKELDDYVWVMSSPLDSTPFHQNFVIEQFQNVIEGDQGQFLNLPMPELKELAVKILKDKQALLFGCDVLQEYNRKQGVMIPSILEYDLVFNTSFEMTRAQRMQFLQARLTHNMVFLGVDLVDDQPVKWKVENSWGDEHGKKGIFQMADTWFDEYVYAIVVNKKYLDKKQTALLAKKPSVLPAWHPLA